MLVDLDIGHVGRVLEHAADVVEQSVLPARAVGVDEVRAAASIVVDEHAAVAAFLLAELQIGWPGERRLLAGGQAQEQGATHDAGDRSRRRKAAFHTADLARNASAATASGTTIQHAKLAPKTHGNVSWYVSMA